VTEGQETRTIPYQRNYIVSSKLSVVKQTTSNYGLWLDMLLDENANQPTKEFDH
jgi:hypothetical protein